MIEKFIPGKDEQGIFETFSDLALCTLAITLVMLSLLATNIGQRINIQLSENQFNMDSAPIRSYIGFSQSSSGEKLLVHFLDAEMVDKLTAYKDSLTQSRIVNLPSDRTMSYENFLLVAPSIIPGVDKSGLSTLSSLPISWEPDVVTPDGSDYLIRWSLGDTLVSKLFPKKQEIDLVKRSRIYVESFVRKINGTEELKKYIVIGHAAYPLPEAIDDGSLEWLRSFESGTADIVYLGDLGETDNKLVNKRLIYFKENNFVDCEEDYIDFLNNGMRKEYEEIDSNFNFEHQSIPLIKHRDAWGSYVQEQIKLDADPPEWFFKEFLVKLGFDRMVMDIPEVQ